MIIRGKAQRFGDNINTDYIIAAQYKMTSLDIADMATHAFEDIDPEFARRVRPGDIVVAGRNFGCGSSRETAVTVLRELKVSAVVASSFARIYFRNAVNSGLPALECDTSAIEQGDELEIDVAAGVVANLTRDQRLSVTALPRIMQEMIKEGGLRAYLLKHGDLVIPS